MNTVTPFDLYMQPPLCSVWCNTNGGACWITQGSTDFGLKQINAIIHSDYNYILHNVSTSDIRTSCSLFVFLLVITLKTEPFATEECVWDNKSKPLPCVVVSCLWQGMQAGRGLAHHWRQPIQYLSGGGQSAPVQRGPPNPQSQPLFQPCQESAAGTPSAVLQPTG